MFYLRMGSQQDWSQSYLAGREFQNLDTTTENDVSQVPTNHPSKNGGSLIDLSEPAVPIQAPY